MKLISMKLISMKLIPMKLIPMKLIPMKFIIRKFILTSLIGCCLYLGGNAFAASVYLYVDKAGKKFYTDQLPLNSSGYALEKKYEVEDYFGLVNRPSKRNTRKRKAVSSQFDALIVQKAGELGLEPALLKAIVHAESSFAADAVSPKGARGLMQLMPATAARYGVSAVHDPLENLQGGGEYMVHLLDLFNNDLELALAAYNAGETAVAKYNGIPPYPETQNYVQIVIELLGQYRQNLLGA